MKSRLSHKTLNGDDNDIGGYLVTLYIVKRINKRIADSSPMRQICSHQKISTKTLDYIIEDCNRAGADWSSEVVDDEDGGYKSKYDFTQDTSTPKIQKIFITTYELYAQSQISQKLLDDAFINVEGWLVEKIAEIFSKKRMKPLLRVMALFSLEEFYLTKIK